jgi:hypothetical protein
LPPPYRRHISLGVFITEFFLSLSKLAMFHEICLRMNLSMMQIDICDRHKYLTGPVHSFQTNLAYFLFLPISYEYTVSCKIFEHTRYLVAAYSCRTLN